MAQEILSAAILNEDAVVRRSENEPKVTSEEIFIRGTDKVIVDTYLSSPISSYEPGFIGPLQPLGPRDADDTARPLIESRITDFAQIAFLNQRPEMMPRQAERLNHIVATAVNDGHLRLNDEYPGLSIAEQRHKFIQDGVKDYTKVTRASLKEVYPSVLEEGLQTIDALREVIALQQEENESLRIRAQEELQNKLAIRQMLEDAGVSISTIDTYNAMAFGVEKTSERPQPADTNETFKGIVQGLIGHRASILTGVKPPVSHPTPIVH